MEHNDKANIITTIIFLSTLSIIFIAHFFSELSDNIVIYGIGQAVLFGAKLYDIALTLFTNSITIWSILVLILIDITLNRKHVDIKDYLKVMPFFYSIILMMVASIGGVLLIIADNISGYFTLHNLNLLLQENSATNTDKANILLISISLLCYAISQRCYFLGSR